MTGDCFHPISVFGYTASEFVEDDVYAAYSRYVEQLNASDTEEDENCEVDLFHCVSYAYTRWESQSNETIFWDHMGETGNKTAFMILGVQITNSNINKLDEIKELLLSLNADKQIKAPLKFFTGILMYPESKKEEYGVYDTESELETETDGCEDSETENEHETETESGSSSTSDSSD
jgi:hypothetical protein